MSFFFFFFFFFGAISEDDDGNVEDDEDEEDEDDDDGCGVNVRSFGNSSVSSPKSEDRICSRKDNACWFGSGSAGGTLSTDFLRCCGAAVDGCDEGSASVGDDCCVDCFFSGCDEGGASVDGCLRLRVDGSRVSPNMKRGIASCMRRSRSSPSAMSNR